MEFKYLPEHLRDLADAVVRYFRDHRGIRGFRPEAEVFPALMFRPTLHAVTREKTAVCVEVLEQPYSVTLEAVVLDCVTRSLPVKLYVAVRSGATSSFQAGILRAQKIGIGIIEVSGPTVDVLFEALPLSLLSVRAIDKKKFPPKYRAPLAEAENTFRHGSAPKGCALVFDEIEALTRRLAVRSREKRYWRSLKPGERPPRVNLETGNWQIVMELFFARLIRSRLPSLTAALMGRILGIIPHRNDSGHKPRTIAEATTISEQLKTRFESAVDLLSDLIQVEKQLR